MRVLLISANTELMNMPVLPLGLGCVARATQETGHEIKIINLMASQNVFGAIENVITEFKPEAIGISVRNIDDQVMSRPKFLLKPVKSMISHCRKYSEAPIIIGGAGYSIFPDAALDYLKADMGIQGEGEVSFPLLLEKLQNNSGLADVPGLFLPKSGMQHNRVPSKRLDDCPLPLPRLHLWAPENIRTDDLWVPFQTRRGCSMQCSYCSTPVIEGKLMRKRNLDHAVNMLSKYAESGFKRFFIVDNVFNLPLSYAKSFCKKIVEKRLNIEWRCIIYPWEVDEKLVEKMAAAGCREVSLGFESGSPEIIKRFNKRYSLKGVRRISDIMKRYRIKRMGFLLLGGPGETKETVMESLSFADSLGLDAMKVTVGIRIYPQTPLTHQAIEDGFIKADDDLLFPKFYVNQDLRDWLLQTVDEWLEDRPNWIM